MQCSKRYPKPTVCFTSDGRKAFPVNHGPTTPDGFLQVSQLYKLTRVRKESQGSATMLMVVQFVQYVSLTYYIYSIYVGRYRCTSKMSSCMRTSNCVNGNGHPLMLY